MTKEVFALLAIFVRTLNTICFKMKIEIWCKHCYVVCVIYVDYTFSTVYYI